VSDTKTGVSQTGTRLAAELERMRVASPSAVLRLSPDAGIKTARSAFLAMVKEFHPHRFARQSGDVQQLANEIFLLVKGAYDKLCAAAPEVKKRTKRGGTSPPIAASRPNRAVRFKRSRPKPEAPIAKKVATPIPAPVEAPVSEETEEATDEVNDATRPANHSQLVAALETEEEERATAFRGGLKLLKAGRPAEAREIFRNLAVNKSSEKKYRVYMHFAWAREHHGAGRLDEAAAEYRRVLKLDPRLKDAIKALDEIAERTSGKQSGVFGRLFRRGR